MGQETCPFTWVSTWKVISFVTSFHDVRASYTVFVFSLALGIPQREHVLFYGMKRHLPI